MELLDRYLQAVKFWLPRKQKHDILAELSEDIRSEIEDKEAELGRPLGQAELEVILTRWGHPMLVAERYLPQRSLIGPVLLPAYKLVLTVATLFYLVPWLLVLLGFAIFDPGAPDVGRHRRRAADVLAHRSARRGRGHRGVRRPGTAPVQLPDLGGVERRQAARTFTGARPERDTTLAIDRGAGHDDHHRLVVGAAPGISDGVSPGRHVPDHRAAARPLRSTGRSWCSCCAAGSCPA